MTNTNTGHKDALGRTIWQGPKGGSFVRGSSGQRLHPAMGRSTAPRNLADLPRNVLEGIGKQMNLRGATKLASLSRSTHAALRNNLRARVNPTRDAFLAILDQASIAARYGAQHATRPGLAVGDAVPGTDLKVLFVEPPHRPLMYYFKAPFIVNGTQYYVRVHNRGTGFAVDIDNRPNVWFTAIGNVATMNHYPGELMTAMIQTGDDVVKRALTMAFEQYGISEIFGV